MTVWQWSEMTDTLIKRGSRSPVHLYRSLSYSGKGNWPDFRRPVKERHIGRKRTRIFLPGACPRYYDILCRAGKDLTFDACITADDELAVGAVKYALSQGKKIPAEFQVTGYNNSLLSTCSTL